MGHKFVAIASLFFALGILLGGFFIHGVDASPLQGAGAPAVVSYQGVISEGGVAYDGTGYFKFAIVNAAGGTTYWSNDGTSTGGGEPSNYVTLAVNDGYFMALLGDTSLANMTALPASVFSGTERYLRIWFSGDGGSSTLLSPDQQFTAVPYALQAQDAATLDGFDSTAFYTQAQVDTLLAAYDSRISDLETLLASVSVENGGDDVVFTGVNVHVRSESGATDGAVNGLGNLIIGYDESRTSGSDKSGSHNLVIGSNHNYTSFGGIVAGYQNTISARESTVTGGVLNVASGARSSVGGGANNTASGTGSSVSGGDNNVASGASSHVSGGEYNVASGDYAAVLGGGGNYLVDGNEAWADYSIVAGGRRNIAGDDSGIDRTVGEASAVLAGYDNAAEQDYASVSGGINNFASGAYSSVSGGYQRSATGTYHWRAGTLFEPQ